MDKTVIDTKLAPKAIGPYSQAIRTGNLLFISGQLPINPADGVIPHDIKAQTCQILENLKSILEAAGTSLSAVVKTTVYLNNLDDFDAMNAVYQAYFTRGAPARSTIEVSQIPRGALIEIEAISLISD